MNQKLTEPQVRLIRLLYPDSSMKQLAEQYGVNVTTVWRAVRGRHWAKAAGPIRPGTRPYRRNDET